MRIDVWSDLNCPFSARGRRHLLEALEGFEHAGEIDLRWHSFERERTPSASFDAHRLHHFARDHDRELPALEALTRAWEADRDLGARETLLEVATEIGLTADAANDMLDSDDYGTAVRTDEALAKDIGITVAPTFILDQRYAVTGAHPAPALLEALRQAWADRFEPVEHRPAQGCGGNGGGGCATCACS